MVENQPGNYDADFAMDFTISLMFDIIPHLPLMIVIPVVNKKQDLP